MEGVTVSTIITAAGEIVTAGAGWVADWAGQITSNPLLLTFAVIPVVGLGVGLLRRLLSVN